MTIPELPFVPVVLGCAVGSFVCCWAALTFGKGYQSRWVQIAVGAVLFFDVLSLGSLFFLGRDDPVVVWGNVMMGVSMLIWGVLIPLLIFGILTEGGHPFRLRLWHAAFVLSGWLVGPVLTFLLWLPYAMGI